MKLIIAKNYADMSRVAANIVEAHITLKADLVLGLATGSSMQKLYQCMAEDYKSRQMRYNMVKAFSLDEYYGLLPAHEQSFAWYFNHHFFEKTDFDVANMTFLQGNALHAEAVCRQYEISIKNAGGIDLQLLGIGGNGHIGFNEPNLCFSKQTHLVQLDETTILQNSRFFKHVEEVPQQAITMGIGTIMKAKHILMLVSGAEKASILAKALQGDITPDVPASILQVHSNFTVVADVAAAAKFPSDFA